MPKRQGFHPLRARRCPNPQKHSYATKARALMVAAKCSRGVELSAYKCPGCRTWHLTSQPRRRNG